jgi:ABC-2 type transport system ATP-binding protein
VPAVEVTNLAKSYGSVTAVADVSFTAEAGAITSVLGPNGAGKTTTIEICAGLQRADSGAVTVLDHDPYLGTPTLRSQIGVMPQGGTTASGIYPSARVLEVLALYAALYEHPLPIPALLTTLGLEKVIATPWRQLSGGEQQRLSLALAIVGRPQVVFLDEPTAGLDVEGRHATWELIKELRTAGVAILLTTHLLDEAEQLADHIVIVDAGRVVASGTPASLLAADAGRGELRFDAPPALPLDELLAALPPALTASELSPGRYLVAGDITPDVVASLTAWCAQRGVMADRLTTGSRSLEDVFLGLTGKTSKP